LELTFLIGCWVAAEVFFWRYWLQSSHVVTVPGFLFNTTLILWFTALPTYFLFFLTRMKRTVPGLPLPPGWKVAMVVTRAPSEPFGLVRRTLEAMLSQRYPHSTWLADEQPDPSHVLWG